MKKKEMFYLLFRKLKLKFFDSRRYKGISFPRESTVVKIWERMNRLNGPSEWRKIGAGKRVAKEGHGPRGAPFLPSSR